MKEVRRRQAAEGAERLEALLPPATAGGGGPEPPHRRAAAAASWGLQFHPRVEEAEADPLPPAEKGPKRIRPGEGEAAIREAAGPQEGPTHPAVPVAPEAEGAPSVPGVPGRGGRRPIPGRVLESLPPLGNQFA